MQKYIAVKIEIMQKYIAVKIENDLENLRSKRMQGRGNG